MKNQDYLRKWLDGSMTGEEKLKFEQSPDYMELSKLDKAIKAFKAPALDVEKELKKLDLPEKTSKTVSLWGFRTLLRAAAVLAGIVGVYFFFIRDPAISVEAIAGEKTQVILPDQSEVMINAASQITYREKKWEQNRTIDLQGEAYFKVAPGSKFEVRTTGGNVTVLGTEFNVKSREGYFEVVCFEGKVRVISNSYLEDLEPAHMFRLIQGTLIKDNNYSSGAPSWISFESSFRSVPFKEVLLELERQYRVRVVANDVDTGQLFTGRFSHKDLDLALQSITQPLNLSYKIMEGQTIVLTSEGP